MYPKPPQCIYGVINIVKNLPHKYCIEYLIAELNIDIFQTAPPFIIFIRNSLKHFLALIKNYNLRNLKPLLKRGAQSARPTACV
jgi:hypothetical protein